MFYKGEITQIVKRNAAAIGISPDELGKLDELIAKSLYDVLSSQDFTEYVVNKIDDRLKHERMIYGGR